MEDSQETAKWARKRKRAKMTALVLGLFALGVFLTFIGAAVMRA